RTSFTETYVNPSVVGCWPRFANATSGIRHNPDQTAVGEFARIPIPPSEFWRIPLRPPQSAFCTLLMVSKRGCHAFGTPPVSINLLVRWAGPAESVPGTAGRTGSGRLVRSDRNSWPIAGGVR